MTDRSEKPLLLVALVHDYSARDLVDSGVLGDLAATYRLVFITSPRLTIDVSPYGSVVAQHRMSSLRFRVYFLTTGLWHMVRKRRFNRTRSYTLRQATFGLSPRMSRTVDLVSRVGLARPVALFGRWLLRVTAPRLLPDSTDPVAALVFTSVRSYFADDVIRDCRRHGLPVLAITSNWDNINGKVFLEDPPYLGVWGEQSFLIARLMHDLSPQRIFVVGAPRFEIYRRVRFTREESRRRLGVPLDARVLLFCGSSVPFDEIALLKELDEAIAGGRLPRDLLVLYKPHPIRFERRAEEAFAQTAFRHVKLVPAGSRELTELERYPELLAGVDALISPFSTMVIEGAYFGLPALCLGYNDPGHANWDWQGTAHNLHVYLIRHGDWAVLCQRRDDFLPGCARLLALIGDPATAATARAAAEMAWMTGTKSVAQRIAAAVDLIAARADADELAPTEEPAIKSHFNPVFSESRLSKE
jgi:hypothetical protein